jgi:hypothetical protein
VDKLSPLVTLSRRERGRWRACEEFIARASAHSVRGSKIECNQIGKLLREEVEASRQLQSLLNDRGKRRMKYRLVHRPLRLS